MCFDINDCEIKLFKNLKCAVFIEFIMARLGIHEHNVPIVAYSLHIEVGVGFPMFGLCTSDSMQALQLRDLKQTLYDVPTHGSPLVLLEAQHLQKGSRF